MLLFAVIILLFPPLYNNENTRPYSLLLLIIHSFCFTLLEMSLYNEEIFYRNRYNRIYNSYFLLITCGIGLYISKRIYKQKYVNNVYPWFLTIIHLRKLSVLCGFSNRESWLVMLFVGVITFPLFIEICNNKVEYICSCIFLSGFILYILRYSILQHLYSILFQSYVPNAVVNSCTLIIWGIVSLLYDKYSIILSPYLHRFVLILLVIASLLYILQPEIQFHLLLLDIYNAIINRSLPFDSDSNEAPLWPPWVLIILIGITLLVVLDIIPIKKSLFLRVCYAVIYGIGLGLYIIGNFYPLRLSIFIVLSMMFVLFTLTLIFLLYPSPFTSKMLLWLYCGLISSLFALLLLVNYLYKNYPIQNGVDYYQTCYQTSLSLFTFISILLAFTSKVTSFRYIKMSANEILQKGYYWHAVIGNISTIYGYASAFILIVSYKDWIICYLAISSLLLCLQHDILLLKFYNETLSKYSPICWSITISLLYRVFRIMKGNYYDENNNSEEFGMFYYVKNIILIICILPSLISTNIYFWNYHIQKIAFISYVPIAAVGLLSNIVTIQVLSVIGIIQGCYAWYESIVIKDEGLRKL